MFHVPNKYRIRTGLMGSDDEIGNCGAFYIKLRDNVKVTVIAADELGWEHVSVSMPYRCPSWSEMCQIKDLFWDPDDAVFQFHPPKSEYVNNHPYCLHLWRPIGKEIPLPDKNLVGLKL